MPPGLPAPPPLGDAKAPEKGNDAGDPPALPDPLAKFPEEIKEMLLAVQKAYGDPEKSKLTYTVKQGSQMYDIVLQKIGSP
jgi:hypothetical protein